MTKHKRQHYIPSSYLEAWCDPNTPSGQTPYVWRFSKDGNRINKKAPQKIFYETDMYTIYTQDGKRDLRLEYNLSKVEGEFSKLRVHKLKQKRTLTSQEHLVLCMFAAAMYNRTKAFAKHQSSQWQKALDLGENMRSVFDNASPEQRNQMSAVFQSSHTGKEKTLSIDHIRKLVKYPIQSMLSANWVWLAQLLYKRPYLILETTDNVGFITSDDPCVWYDPDNYQIPRPLGAGGLVSPTLEITLPLSPNQMLFFGSELIASGVYVQINDAKFIDVLNQRTRIFSEEYFVSTSSIIDPGWFNSNNQSKRISC